MALIVAPEKDFDAYVSLADADDYAARMGLSAWEDYEGDKSILLRRGTQYIRTKYRPAERYISPEVHRNIQAATVEAAVRAIDGQLGADIDRTQLIKREKIDVLETEFLLGADYRGELYSFPIIDGLMEGLSGATTGSVFMLKRI